MSVIWTFVFGAIPYNTGTKYIKYIVYDRTIVKSTLAPAQSTYCTMMEVGGAISSMMKVYGATKSTLSKSVR